MLSLWFFLLFAVVFLGWIGFAMYKKKNRSYWPKRNVPFYDSSNLLSIWERLRFKYGLHEMEQMTYEAIKKEGNKKYMGLVEFGIPALYVMDLNLVKTILVRFWKFNDSNRKCIYLLHNSNPSAWACAGRVCLKKQGIYQSVFSR